MKGEKDNESSSVFPGDVNVADWGALSKSFLVPLLRSSYCIATPRSRAYNSVRYINCYMSLGRTRWGEKARKKKIS